MSDWDFGGAFARTSGELQRQDQEAQLFPARLAHEAATARLNNANAIISEQKVASEKNMAQLMQGMEFGEGGADSSSIMKLAGVAMKAGDATTARDMIMRAAQLRSYESSMAATAARTKSAEATAMLKRSDRYAQLLSGVKSQEDLDQANFIYQSEFGLPAALQEYDPRAVNLVRQSTVKIRDQIYADHTKTMEGLAAARLASTNAYRNGLLGIRQADLDRKVQADKTREKNAGKDVGAPSKAEMAAADDLLAKEDKTRGLDKETRRTAAFDVAARARALRRQNPGLDAGEALTRALGEQVAEGYFTTKKATSLLGGLLGKTTTAYGRPGRSVDAPLTIPKDRSAMKAQTYYTTPKGTLLYLGEGKWQVPQAAQASTSRGTVAPPDDDDDED